MNLTREAAERQSSIEARQFPDGEAPAGVRAVRHGDCADFDAARRVDLRPQAGTQQSCSPPLKHLIPKALHVHRREFQPASQRLAAHFPGVTVLAI